MHKWGYYLDNVSVEDYRNYIVSILKRRSKVIEEILASKLIKAIKAKPKVKRRLKLSSEVFELKAYILGYDVDLESSSGIKIPLRIASNPSITLDGDDVVIFMRLSSLGGHPIPNPWSRTFIGLGRIPLNYLSGRIKLHGELILYPLVSVERVEDPRIYMDYVRKELYHVRAIKPYKSIDGSSDVNEYVITFTSRLGDDWKPRKMEPVRFKHQGEEYIISDYRDTFPLNNEFMIVRPWVSKFEVGGILIAERDEAVVDTVSIRAYPELMPLEWERKTGSNCVAKLSRNEYLLFFHGVDDLFGTYHTYVALLSSSGELLGVSPEPVITPRPKDYVGARPSTVFVCGAQVIKDKIIVSAGKDDEITIFLEAEIDKLLSRIEYIQG